VGGVSERAGAKAGGSNPFANRLLRVSWRSKASRSFERRRPSRGGVGKEASVGPSLARVSSREGAAPTTADVRRSPRRGTPSRMRHKAYAPDAGTRDRRMRFRETRPSLGPSTRACRSSLCTAAQASVVRRTSRHHGWANPREWEEPTLGSGRTDAARLAACHRFRKGEGVARKKRKEVEASVPARITSPGLVARTSMYVAEVGRRRLASNKLGKRAPKRAVRVE
jgi:hypothetical protein